MTVRLSSHRKKKTNCGFFVILKSHNSYVVSALLVVFVPQKGLNVQIIVIILYKIWSKSWFVSGFFVCLFLEQSYYLLK